MAEQDRKTRRGKPPISRHPLFPATVALWFGALLGTGGLALSPAVLDGIAKALHLGVLGSAFEPPVHTAGRVAVVLALAAIGGALGLVAARRIARIGSTAEIKPAAPRPAVQADLNKADSALWSELKSRRRELAVEQQPTVALAPPTGTREAHILDVASFELASFDAEPVVAEPITEQAPADDYPVEFVSDEWLVQEEPASEEIEPEIARSDAASNFPEKTAAERIAGAPLTELSHVELLERLALSMQQRSERHAAAMQPQPTDELTCEAAPPLQSSSELTQVHAALDPHAQDDDADQADVVTAGEAVDIADSPLNPTTPLSQPDADERDEIVEEALADGYSSLLELGLPGEPRPFVRAASAAEPAQTEPAIVFPGHAQRRHADRAQDAPGNEPLAGPGYRPFTPPATAEAIPQSAEETEKALRAALAALQRMSGTA